MYNFVDTVEHTSEAVLPSEAMQFNGDYIEEVIEGYRTLYVKGRDTLSPEVEIDSVGVRDGAYMKNRRFPARTITIGYQLLAADEEDFREKFNALNDLLNTVDAQLIFADEDDKYFIGTPSGYTDVPEGRNNITSEFEIVCTDPFKYSLTEYEVAPTDGTFSVNYQGTYPAYPTLEADFYRSDVENDTAGECGYVAYVNDRGNVLQFGNPSETDEVAVKVQEIIDETTTQSTIVTQNKRLITDSFAGYNIDEWDNAGYYTQSDVNKRSGAIAFTRMSETQFALTPNTYGSTSVAAWHGPTGCKTVPTPALISGATSVERSADFQWCFKLRFAPAAAESTAKKQSGTMQAFVLDSNNKVITGIQVWKNSGTLKGNVRIYVHGDGAVKTWKNIDLSRYNKYFGFKKGDTKPKMGVTITKTGGKFTFDIGGLTFTYMKDSLANSIGVKVSFYFGRWKAEPEIDTLAIYSTTFNDTATKYTVPVTKTEQNIQYLTQILDQENSFGTNDVLIADCQNAEVWLNSIDTEESGGVERPDLGALGNDWEQFTLEKGENYISTMYSEWVADQYKPTFKLRYRERFL